MGVLNGAVLVTVVVGYVVTDPYPSPTVRITGRSTSPPEDQLLSLVERQDRFIIQEEWGPRRRSRSFLLVAVSTRPSVRQGVKNKTSLNSSFSGSPKFKNGELKEFGVEVGREKKNKKEKP